MDPGGGAGIRHPNSIRERYGEWLLHKDVLSSRCGFADMFVMEFVRCGNVDQLDLWIGTELVDRLIGFAAELPNEGFTRHRSRLGCGSKPDVRVFDERRPAEDESPAKSRYTYPNRRYRGLLRGQGPGPHSSRVRRIS